ncbi:NAD(P)H oxidoreductase [Agrobacterium sp. CNPSo 3708]|uniref:NAD(P)H oxidoreductase n=1 Tax=unclassified Agrobacterium TaxID=2632611 RepID=UPI0023635221|nr:NAD(P)H oxidoreductase [Agrobacterium sp. CNPSo 3708]MDD1497058.1 NAD(P)H oxidoreductase [Agrobacterium sp. CNPSo 3708]
MQILVVIAHPRENSLTHQAGRAFAEAARANGHEVEFADLVAENFDPVLKAEDEPDWSGRDIDFAEDVRREMERVERNDATVLFFPVWWWSMPAILKGWIDRVWAQNWAFGNQTYPHAKVSMVGIAGATEDDYRKRGYDIAMRTQLKVGILDYCSVKEGKVELLYGSLEGEAQAAAIISNAKDLGARF